MATEHTTYTRSQWAGLSIQERIRAMNNNMDLVDASSISSNSKHEAPLQIQSSPQAPSLSSIPQEGEDRASSSVAETPRRASVVEMWRRRDSNSGSKSKLNNPQKSAAAAVTTNRTRSNHVMTTTTTSSSSTPTSTRSNHVATATATASSLFKASDHMETAQGINTQEEEKKQDDEELDNSNDTPTLRTSTVRNMWNQRVNLRSNTPSPSRRVTARHAVVKQTPHQKPTSVDTKHAKEEDADVDLTIVPSPNKSSQQPGLLGADHNDDSNNDQRREVVPNNSTTKSRPTNVADFWAQRGLKPIKSSNQDSISSTNDFATWKQQREGTNQAKAPSSSSSSLQPKPVQGTEKAKEDAAADATSPPAKVSVVDRWKQRVSSPTSMASPAAKNTSSAEETRTPTRKPVAERWKAAVHKPTVEAASPSTRAKVTDRWFNRQQSQQEQPQPQSFEKSTPKRLSSSGVSIPGILASPTSRTHTTASTTSSWRTEQGQMTDEDDVTTAADSMPSPPRPEAQKQRLVHPVPPMAPSPVEAATPNHQQHVTKRWSNRLISTDPSRETTTRSMSPSPQQSRFLNVPSSPASQRSKGGIDSKQAASETPGGGQGQSHTPLGTPTRKKPHLFSYTSPLPTTPQSQTQTTPDRRSQPRTPDSRTFLPDLKHTSTPKSASSPSGPPLRQIRSTTLSPKLKIPEMRGFGRPRSPSTRIPDFNMFTPKSSPQVNSASSQEKNAPQPSTPLSPLSSTRRSVGTLSPKFRHENSAPKKSTPNSWPSLPVPASPRAEKVERNETREKSKGTEPRLLVLISGQSLSRGRTSLNQQIDTILKGHNIPYEKMDGSILSVRDRRNELFKISGLWAEYPQFFIRENGQTIFWGTWDTLQQCNDAGKVEEEFAPAQPSGQSSSSTTVATNTYTMTNQVAADRTQRLSIKLSSPTAAPGADEKEDIVPPLTKRKSGEPDEDDERTSITCPTRTPRSAFGVNSFRMTGLAKAAPDSLDKKKFLARKHVGSAIKQKIDEDSVLEGSVVNVEYSANVSVADDSRTAETTAMDESVTAQTIGDSVTTASTAPRLGAKSLDSLERKDRREKTGSDSGTSQTVQVNCFKKKIMVSDIDAILQRPPVDTSSENASTERQQNVFAAWPPPKKPSESSSRSNAGTASPPPRSFSPSFLPRLNLESANLPAGWALPSPAVSHTGTAESIVSRASGSSLTSSTLVKRDFNSPRAKRIGQRLIEKKRELQAHRQRLKKSRSNDSSDALPMGAENENGAASESVTGSDNRSVLLNQLDEKHRSLISKRQTQHASSIERELKQSRSANGARTPDSRPGRPVTTPRTPNGSFFGQASPTIAKGSPENGSFSPSRGTPWSSHSAFSPLDYRSPRNDLFLSSDSDPLSSILQRSSSSSPKKVGSPHSESGMSFLDMKSDGSNSVASRGSALSLRAERVLKQRRQKGTLAGVEEGVEVQVADDRKHAHELARNVVYGHPTLKNKQSAEKVKKWNRLRVETTETDQSTLQATDQSTLQATVASEASSPSQDRSSEGHNKSNGSVLGETKSMIRQRASLSSRYNTSDRFMDFDAASKATPPASTKSLPGGGRAAPLFMPHSTRSAPGNANGLYAHSNETPDDTPCTSSEDYRSMSSQTSRTDSAAHTSRPSMMTATMPSANDSMRSHHGIHDDFVTESAYSYDALRTAYANMTFGQLAADFAGEVSNALNLGRLQNDVKKAFSGIRETNSDPTTGRRSKPRQGLVCSDLVPFDEEDVAIEVEYMEYDEETLQGNSYAFCEAKTCGSPTKCASYDEPSRGRRRVGEV